MAKKVKSDNESEPEIDPAIERELEANNMLLFNIGEAYAERLGALEREFDQKRAPVYKTRDAILAKIPQFWLTVFLNHKTINSMLTREDVDVLEYLETFTAVTTSDETAKRETHTVTFGFRENPYFKNKVLTKKLTDFIPEEEVLTRVDTIESTKIEWNEGKDFTKTQSSKDVPKPGGKRNREDQGHFFSWFCGDDDIDSFAEVFTQDVYINAYELFLDPEDDEEDDDEEDDDEEEDEDEDE